MSIKLFIDPSINSMGWALWKSKTHLCPDNVGLLHSPDLLWHYKAIWMAKRIFRIINNNNVDLVCCEMPTFFGTLKGHSANSTSAIYKLSTLVGMITYVSRECHIKLVTPTMWKGQLPKSIVESRIIKILGKENCTQFKADIWDAVGIGLWSKGLL